MQVFRALEAAGNTQEPEEACQTCVSGNYKGGFASNGSGDYVIAFSTHPDVRRNPDIEVLTRNSNELKNDAMSPLFLAAVESTEEAILNSLFTAETMTGQGGRTMNALPVEEMIEILKKYGAIRE